MQFLETAFPGLIIIEPQVFPDSRGYFFESYNEQKFATGGINIKFVQDNQAKSSYGVVRGLHFQHPPYAQTKLIRVLQGTIIDAVVDMRKGSPTYGQSFYIELSDVNKKQLLVPKGFAHGYSVLSDTAEVLYKCDAFYKKEAEGGVDLRDTALQIKWGIPLEKMILSEKDMQWNSFAEAENYFKF